MPRQCKTISWIIITLSHEQGPEVEGVSDRQPGESRRVHLDPGMMTRMMMTRPGMHRDRRAAPWIKVARRKPRMTQHT